MEDNNKDLTYSEALRQLEDIVRKMQAPDCDIDLLADYTSKALRLLKFCKEKLHTTDEEVQKCLEELSATTE